jgi:molybdenum cofactor cytidylyltransferase
MRPFSVVLLAAGESSRLGRPKQLVEIDGSPLIVRAISVALEAVPLEVIVVLGAYAEEIEAAVARDFGLGAEPEVAASSRSPIRIVVNEGWAEGMGSSIRVGVEAVDASSKAAVLMLCDQPRVSTELLLSLAEALSDSDGISATEYEGRAGAPCAFARAVFPELLKLQGDRGARDLIRDPARNVALVPFESAAADIDTQSDISTYATRNNT